MSRECVGICVNSIHYKAIIETHIPIKDGFDFAEALGLVYPLLDIIFSYLDFQDLKAASKVIPSWEAAAAKELSKRVSLNWVHCISRKKNKALVVRHSEFIPRANVECVIIFYDYVRVKLNKYICLHGHIGNIGSVARMTFAEYFQKEIVPEGVDYCVISCSTVEPVFTGYPPLRELSVFDAVLLPKIPNIKVTMFYCNPKYDYKVKEIVDCYVKPGEKLKCLLLFPLSTISHYISNLFKYFIPDNNFEEVALCGGIISGTKMFKQVNSQRTIMENDVLCVAFLEESVCDSSFNASSLVINGDDLSEDEFEEKLVKFKEKLILRTNSMAFRICCAAKWATKTSESHIFSKVFQTIPLIGMEANGEIGWNSINNTKNSCNFEGNSREQRRKKKPKVDHPKVHHQWTTVIMILTWGKILEK